jgi:hypothetical protein
MTPFFLRFSAIAAAALILLAPPADRGRIGSKPARSGQLDSQVSIRPNDLSSCRIAYS